MDVWDGIDAQRRTLCDLLETLTPKQWTTTSLCPEWTVGEVAAHLVADHTVTTRRFLATLVRTRGSVDAANNLLTAEEAARPPRELVADLRRHAENRYVPPGLGVGAVITEMFLHGQDIRVPLGLVDPLPVECWSPVLDFLVSRRARIGYFVSGRLPRLHYRATDLDWSCGTGEEVSGPAAALALAVSGRAAHLDQLSGPGALALQARIP